MSWNAASILIQGDQVERIFTYWAIVNFGQLFGTCRNRQIFGLLFPWSQLRISFDSIELGYILADFFTHHLVTL
jgi:hypothetical protein